ncbi:hypothetical protein RDI58_000628 [Solanum bulbocastanum]|uniref:Uncharacterized protein n=1 Tax=Solanum bulbocastanum TaxID=147425 RepID=A0AAN8YPA6_SOLBU
MGISGKRSVFPQEHAMEFQNLVNKEEDEYDFQISCYDNKVSMIRKVIMKQDTNYIPINKASLFNGYKYNFFEDEYTNDDDVEMVLPHMIIRRRISRRMMAN